MGEFDKQLKELKLLILLGLLFASQTRSLILSFWPVQCEGDDEKIRQITLGMP
jgi:hypothetical protein